MAPVPDMSPMTIKVGQIDDVQELAKSTKLTIPERFIRDETERPVLLKDPSSTMVPGGVSDDDDDVPVIDLSKIVNEKDEEELSKLADACEHWGFFQVVNHGVDTNLLVRMEEVAMEFFMLPLAEKQKYPMIPGTVQGYGQAFIFSEDQKLDWCNMFALALEPKHSRNLSLWPDKPHTFRETIEKYSSEIRTLCKQTLRIIARSLNLHEHNLFDEMFGEAVQAVRMNYYPPCPRPDLVMGLSPHSDGSAITVLQQGIKAGSDVPAGLQILKDGKWVTVKPVPDALVINLGDTLEVLTNGKYKSVEHRAVTMETEDRLSIVTFYAPSYDVELGPLPEFVGADGGAKYRRYLHGEYAKHYVTNKLQGKKTIEFTKIQR